MQYWNPTYECMHREEMTRVQTARLIDTVKRVYHNVPYYREKMQKAGIEPETLIHWRISRSSRLPINRI